MRPASQLQQPPKPSRMTLQSVKVGRQPRPIRAVIFGPEGVGKTTLGADAPKPIFIGAEDGTSRMDVARFPTPESWKDILDAVDTLTREDHPYKTLVLDTLDWAEPLVWKAVVAKDTKGATSIEEVGGGFQKGYLVAIDEWRNLLSALERLQAAKPMHVILLAHSQIKMFKNPEGEDYERYELKLNNKASGLFKEWCDALLFANHETFARKEKPRDRARGFSNGARYLYTSRAAAFDAKNRYGLPDAVPLDWAELEGAVARGEPAKSEEILEAIGQRLGALSPENQAKVSAAVDRAGNDAVKLHKLLTWITAKLPKEE